MTLEKRIRLARNLVRAALAINGVTDVAVAVDATGTRDAGGRPLDLVRINARGWSPSLHLARLATSVAIAEGDLDALARHVDPIAARQRDRQMHAYGIGRRSEPYASAPNMKVDHLEADRAVVALAAPLGVSLRTTMRSGLNELHDFGMHMCDDVFHDGTRGVMEIARTDGVGHHRMALVGLHPDGRGADRIAFDGRHLTVHGRTLPESALATLVGRPAGDLLAAHPLIDARPILAVENVEDDVVATLAPDPVPVPPREIRP